MTTPDFEERSKGLLARVFRGLHHVYKLKREHEKMFSCLHYGSLSSYDFDELTKLVLGAHEYCVRVEIRQAGPQRLQILVSDRERECEHTYGRHPTIEQAIERWNA